MQARFDDLVLISRSQVYQNHKLQVVFRFFVSTGVMVHGCTEKIKHSVFCAAGMYLRDITNTIFINFALEYESAEHLLLLFVLLCYYIHF